MTTDFRALCAELADNLHTYQCWYIEDNGYSLHELEALLRRADAALAEPEPEGPTKAELRQIFDDHSGYINDEQVMWWSDFHAAARAILARWGTPNSVEIRRSMGDAPQPLPVLPEGTQVIEPPETTLLVPVAQPIPVSERLPGPGDLHPTEGWCWVASEDCPAWHRVTVHFDAWFHWLPAHALPVPADD